MSLKDLDSLFRPKSIAVIGASNRPKSIGYVVMRNLLNGGFAGPILPINPRYKAVAGVLAYPDLKELPLSPDLAIICTPPHLVPDYLSQLGKIGGKTALIMSTDLDKVYHQGESVEDICIAIGKEHSLRILGPNCLGIIIPRIGINASFGVSDIPAGQIAFISQSDSLGMAVLDWAHAKGIGFSTFLSLGDSCDINFDEIIDYLAGDPYTSSILLYIEHIKNPRKFISAARSASRNKPLVVIKSASEEGEESLLHLEGGIRIDLDKVYDALFRRSGMLRVFDVAELFDAVETLARSKPLRGDRLAILSNGGGPAIMAKTKLLEEGGTLATLETSTLENLKKEIAEDFFGINPVRIIDHASSDIYSIALSTLLKDRNVDAVMVIHVPSAFTSSRDIAGAIVNTIGQSRKNVFTVWLGEESPREARRIFALSGIPTYETPDQAVRIFMDLVKFKRNQELLMETPDSVPKEFIPNPDPAKQIVKNALKEGRDTLSLPEIKEILSLYSIEVVETRLVESAEEASLVAKEIGYPVCLKIASPDIENEQVIGAVAWDLENEEEIKKAAQAILGRVIKARPEAQIDGFVVQKMSRRPHAFELFVGVCEHKVFGPVMIFGQGGVAGSISKDFAVGFPPLNMTLAKEVMQHTEIYKLLKGEDGFAAVDMDALRLTLVQLSQLIIDIPQITEISITPLLADTSGTLAVDASIKIAETNLTGAARLVIRPYPEYLEEYISLPSGLNVLIRPIRPEDEKQHLKFMEKLSEYDLRMRFFGFVHHFTHSQMAHLTQIDYDREMAFIAINLTKGEDQNETIGEVRAYFDPDNTSAEFAIVVRTDLKLKGLGTILLDKMIRYCKMRGTKELMAYTLRDNKAMQALAKKLGFSIKTDKNDPETIILTLDLESLPREEV